MWKKYTISSVAAVFLALGLGLDSAQAEEKEKAEVPLMNDIAALKVENGKVRITGSRIARDVDSVRVGRTIATSSGLRVYTREDIERSGHVHIGDALRYLDPRIR
ncbi:hypothetical protein [Natronospira sp.]|uniref:hypothetical protein n=1 Tax=Natronospira sp. TaxID=2024970 RepID=UPI003872BC9C